ncbi:hypothetical protein TNCV_2207071 [Trichonephila clavipes]|uniref:Uncharacterized protein n=1 Tax=Trichonephila clavipes TaxID=2585209 RepID=A0A8X6S2J8_TRICX|nr:hypothetical protein TNCV_2207071 [Trichonephila clavipes]
MTSLPRVKSVTLTTRLPQPWLKASSLMGALSPVRLDLNQIMIRITLIVKISVNSSKIPVIPGLSCQLTIVRRVFSGSGLEVMKCRP